MISGLKSMRKTWRHREKNKICLDILTQEKFPQGDKLLFLVIFFFFTQYGGLVLFNLKTIVIDMIDIDR